MKTKKQAYRIDIIDTRFQDYLPDIPESEMGVPFNRWMESTRLLEPIAGWLGLFPVYVRSPHLPASDFFNAPLIGRFAVSERVFGDSTMREMIENAGEFLPMALADNTSRNIYAFNALLPSRIDGLVHITKCEHKFGRISKIAFHNERLPDGGLFTVPEYKVGVFAVHSPDLPPEKDFVQWYRKQGYTGLKLIEAEKAYM